jgi:hypothetical protein
MASVKDKPVSVTKAMMQILRQAAIDDPVWITDKVVIMPG